MRVKKKVLVLGAGLVARPLVRYLLDTAGFRVRVTSRTLSKARDLVGGHPGGKPLSLNVNDDQALEEEILWADLVVSLVPYVHHPKIASIAVSSGVHLVTTSYVSPAMRELDEPAKKAGVLLLNEIGLDPGIDHMSAMKIIASVRDKGGSISAFRSYCGGLPAPEANDNPFGYKFSWSPRGVVLAGRNAARFLENGKVVEIPGPELFDHFGPLDVEGAGRFEAYPNRDSMPYIDLYGLQGIGTMVRGTLRNPGWCAVWKKMADLGLLDDSVHSDLAGKPYGRIVSDLVGGDGDDPAAEVASFLHIDPDSEQIKKMGSS